MVDGNAVFWTFGKSQKILNLRRDPKMTGLVESGDTYDQLRGVELRGTGLIIDDYDEILEIGKAVGVKYNGPIGARRLGAAVPRSPGHETTRRRVRDRARRQLGPHQARRRLLTPTSRLASATRYLERGPRASFSTPAPDGELCVNASGHSFSVAATAPACTVSICVAGICPFGSDIRGRRHGAQTQVPSAAGRCAGHCRRSRRREPSHRRLQQIVAVFEYRRTSEVRRLSSCLWDCWSSPSTRPAEPRCRRPQSPLMPRARSSTSSSAQTQPLRRST